MANKFNVGDKVMVRKDMKLGEVYGGLTLLSGMAASIGDILTIKSTEDGKDYRVEENGFYWSEEMLVAADKLIFKGKETILIKDGKKYVSKCQDGDVYDKEKGLLLCLAKANGVNYSDLQAMIDGAEDKNMEAALKAAKVFGEAVKAFVEAGRKAWEEIGTEVKSLKKEAENTVKEVKRPAKEGEYIKIVKAMGTGGFYENGEVRKVCGRISFIGVIVEEKQSDNGKYLICDSEYVVLENYKPYKITLSEFWKGKDNVAIHCKTEDEAKELCKAFDKAGKTWRGGVKYTEETKWEEYKDQIHYYNDGLYSSNMYIEDHDVIVYEFNEVDLNN